MFLAHASFISAQCWGGELIHSFLAWWLIIKNNTSTFSEWERPGGIQRKRLLLMWITKSKWIPARTDKSAEVTVSSSTPCTVQSAAVLQPVFDKKGPKHPPQTVIVFKVHYPLFLLSYLITVQTGYAHQRASSEEFSLCAKPLEVAGKQSWAYRAGSKMPTHSFNTSCRFKAGWGLQVGLRSTPGRAPLSVPPLCRRLLLGIHYRASLDKHCHV